MTAVARSPRARKLTVVVAFTAVLCGGLGAFASQVIRSPQQILAETRPPVPTVLTAKVRSAVLQQHLVFAGTVRPGRQNLIALGGEGTITGVNTRPGGSVGPGDLLMSVNDRPRLVLPGAVGLYRILGRGDRGRDVERLQRSLADSGYRVAIDGSFGQTTESALSELYRRAGFPAPSREPPSAGTVAGGARSGSGSGPIADPAELYMVPRLPARVTAVSAALGAPAVDATVTVTAAAPVIEATVNPADAAVLASGARVECELPDGSTIGARVAHVGAPQAGANGVTVPLRIRPGRVLPVALAGRSVVVRARVAIAGLGLQVPSAAIYTNPDGSTVVRTWQRGRAGRIQVRVVAEADGRAQVVPGSAGLVSGIDVVVGVG